MPRCTTPTRAAPTCGWSAQPSTASRNDFSVRYRPPGTFTFFAGSLCWSSAGHARSSAMDVRAAVAYKAGAPLAIETVQLAGPKAGEVLVEIKATGICHTDEYTRSGADA